MYVQLEGNLAFLAHPRTASRATRDLLLQRGFKGEGGHHHGPPEIGLNGRIAFCTVRNHFDAITSWFDNFMRNHDKPMTARWIRNFVSQHPDYFRPQGMWWYTYLNPQPVILRYENLQGDLDAFLESHGIRPGKLEVIGASSTKKTKHYRDFYTDETIEVVEELWGSEISALGYQF